MKQLILMQILKNNDGFKSFNYKAKLIGNAVAEGANGILKKCSNFCVTEIFKSFLEITRNAID